MSSVPSHPRRLATFVAAALILLGAAPAAADDRPAAPPSGGEPGTTAPAEPPAPKVVDQVHLDELDAEERALLAARTDASAQAAQLNDEIARLAVETTTAQHDITAGGVVLVFARLRSVAAAKRRDDAAADVDRQRGELRRAAANSFVHGGRSAPDTVSALAAPHPSDAAVTQVYAHATTTSEAQAVARFQTAAAEHERLAVAADRELRAAVDEQSRLDRRRRDLEAAIAASLERQQQLSATLANLNDTLARIEARRVRYLAEIHGTEANLAALLAAVSNGDSHESALIGVFSHPLPGFRHNSGFGWRTDPVYGTAALHKGVDFAAPTGTPIRAAADGVVIKASDGGDGYGIAVVISHGNGVTTLYGHQSAVAVAAGDQVSRGQVIGYVGSTGKSTGPHLHFEVRINGTPVNPAPTIA